MSLGYATQRGMTNSSPLRRWSQMRSFSTPPAPPVTNPTIGMTAQGTAQTSTAQFKYGNASMTMTDNSSFIENTSGDFAWWPSGTGPFTIQWWQYIPSSVSNSISRHICSNEETSGGFGLRLGRFYNSTTINAINIFARGSADLNYYDYTWTRDAWQFVSVCRSGTDIFVHVDGVLLTLSGGSGAGTRNFVATSGLNKIEIGNSGDVGLNGIYIDDFQVFGSTAVYSSSNYTPPTSQAVLTTGTTALFNMNGTNGGSSFPNVTS